MARARPLLSWQRWLARSEYCVLQCLDAALCTRPPPCIPWMQGVNADSFKLPDWAQNVFCVVIDLVSVSKFQSNR